MSELRGSASELHGRALPSPDVAGRSVEVLAIERPALVLGSTQRLEEADLAVAAALGVEVVRRRSGGGAVYLLPGQDLWVDVTIPRSDPLWDDDVARSFHWLGRTWATALGGLGIDGHVHTGPSRTSSWSRRVCFAGVGAGEVLVQGRKVVGLAQRRTRDAARLQCAVLAAWDPVTLLGLLALTERERMDGLIELADVATGVGAGPPALLDALRAALP